LEFDQNCPNTKVGQVFTNVPRSHEFFDFKKEIGFGSEMKNPHH
jgi:hypothetical protein